MATRIYGTSDDLIEFEGDVRGEVDCFGTDEREHGVGLLCSDGTILEVKYCGRVGGVWEIKLLQKGLLFKGIDLCTAREADPYSDQAHFADGLTRIWAATQWEEVK